MPSPKNKNIGHKIMTGINIFSLLFKMLIGSISLCLTLYFFINVQNLTTRIILTVLVLYTLIVFLRGIILLMLYFLEINISRIDPLELSPTLTRRKAQFIKIQSILTKLANLTYLMYDYSIFIIGVALLAFFDCIYLKQWNINGLVIFILSFLLWIAIILLFIRKLKRK